MSGLQGAASYLSLNLWSHNECDQSHQKALPRCNHRESRACGAWARVCVVLLISLAPKKTQSEKAVSAAGQHKSHEFAQDASCCRPTRKLLRAPRVPSCPHPGAAAEGAAVLPPP